MKRYSEDLSVVGLFIFIFNLTTVNFPLKCEQYFHSVNWRETLLGDLDDSFSEVDSYLFGI